MTRTVVLAVLACFLVPAVQAANAPEPWIVEFSTPAQVDGPIVAQNLSWVLILFRPDDSGSFVWSQQGGQIGEHTFVKVGMQNSGYLAPPSTSSYEDSTSQKGTTAFTGNSWASLYIRANQIRFDSAHSGGTLRTTLAQQQPGAHMAEASAPGGTWRFDGQQDAPPGAAWSSGGDNGSIPFHLEATGIQQVEWHNATVACRLAGPCPVGGATTEATQGLPGGPKVEVMEYGELKGGSTSLSGNGSVAVWATGGTQPTITVDGQVRLPLVKLIQSCAKDCVDPQGKTLQLTGNVTLAGLRSVGGDANRLQASLAGTISSGRLDETPLKIKAVAVGIVAGASLLTALALLLRFLWVGRSEPTVNVLDQPRRRQLHELIAREPGMGFHEIRRALSLPSGTATHHLRILEEEGIIVGHKTGNRRRYFQNHGLFDDSWNVVSLLRDHDLKTLYEWLRPRGAVLRSEVLAQTASWGWKTGISQYRLARLAEANLVSIERIGKLARYAATQPANS